MHRYGYVCVRVLYAFWGGCTVCMYVCMYTVPTPTCAWIYIYIYIYVHVCIQVYICNAQNLKIKIYTHLTWVHTCCLSLPKGISCQFCVHTPKLVCVHINTPTLHAQARTYMCALLELIQEYLARNLTWVHTCKYTDTGTITSAHMRTYLHYQNSRKFYNIIYMCVCVGIINYFIQDHIPALT